MDGAWRGDLERWLEPFLAALSHPARRRMCPLYVAGLIGPGERKSMQPMATRAGEVGYDQLHHFVAAGVWEAGPLEAALLAEADRLVGGKNAFLVVDDTALPKKGRHSVGVAPQYATVLGKNANCQTLVSLTLAQREVPVMVGLRLFLPESWTSDPERLTRARVPQEHWILRHQAGDRDTGDRPRAGRRRAFRLRSGGRRLRPECSVPSGPERAGPQMDGGHPGQARQVYPADVEMIFPVAARGGPRKRHIPDQLSVAAETVLAGQPWRSVSWRRGTKGRLAARFAALRVRAADGPPQRIHDMGAQHLPGEEVWVVGEQRSTGERKYYLSNLPADTSLKQLAAAIKARWVCEQAHQQLKEELGLDHFEGRSWTGLHRHTLMAMIAYAFLQSRRLAQAGREKKSPWPAASAHPTRRPAGHPQCSRAAPAHALPALRQVAPTGAPAMICQSSVSLNDLSRKVPKACSARYDTIPFIPPGLCE
jgi:SRSO17 transposase